MYLCENVPLSNNEEYFELFDYFPETLNYSDFPKNIKISK